jgi:release factor glutamine methyltransferase
MSSLPTIADTVRSAAQRLAAHSESPRLDAELLLGRVLGLSRSALIARDHEPVSRDNERAYAALVLERSRGIPIAYLTGSREFWSLPLAVTPAVLVPRPETESLVEHALQLISADEACCVLDLGTGSGAIALGLACERPHWAITGVDLSPQALKVAAQNARSLNMQHIQWRTGNWFDAVPGERFNLIVANPPYIAAGDSALAKLSAEPALALTAGPTGLDALAAIIAGAPRYLHARGWLVLEHGATQALQVVRFFEQHGFASIRTYPDLSGRPRVTLGTVHTQH